MNRYRYSAAPPQGIAAADQATAVTAANLDLVLYEQKLLMDGVALHLEIRSVEVGLDAPAVHLQAMVAPTNLSAAVAFAFPVLAIPALTRGLLATFTLIPAYGQPMIQRSTASHLAYTFYHR